MRLVTTVLVLAAGVLSFPHPSRAAVPACGQAITTASNGQTHPAITGDGFSGAIVAWQDHRDPKVNIFAQHMLGSGDIDARWPFDGLAMINDTSLAGAAGGNFRPRIVPDGAGGAIVAWVDLRDGVRDKLDIIAQHVLASGVVDSRWPANGATLVAVAGLQDDMGLISDGAGGAFVTWTDNRAGVAEFDVYAQHVLGSGLVDARWPLNGLGVCTAPGLQELPAIVEDGAGGALIMWDDARNPANGRDIFAHHVLVSGVVDPAWPVNGRAVCTAAGEQGGGTITRDDAHGAIVAWSDSRVVGTSHIFADHVLATGVVDPVWPVNGRAISNAATTESRPLAVPDGAGGAVLSWQAVVDHVTMFAQHVTAGGVVDPVWPAGGRGLSATAQQPRLAEIATDGLGGALVAWEDSSRVFVQHVLATGVVDPAYPDVGRQVCTEPTGQGDVALVGTVRAGAIATWVDGRNGKDLDVYAVQIQEAGVVAVPAPTASEVRFSRPSPNPARSTVTLQYVLPRETSVSVAIYDAEGRRVRKLAAGVESAGPHAIAWDLRDDNGRAVGAGLYLATLEVKGQMFERKVVARR